MSIPISRQPKGQPTGGQFSEHQHTEASTVLEPRRSVRVPFSASVFIPFHSTPLPPLPERLGKPTVDFYTDEEDFSVITRLRFPDDFTVSIYEGPDGDWTSSIADGSEVNPDWGADETEMVLAYGEALAHRIENGAHTVREGAFSSTAAVDRIVDAAIGSDYTQVGNVDPDIFGDHDPDGTVAARGRERAREILHAHYDIDYDEQGDDHETAVGDALTDLLHYAAKYDLDIDDLVNRAIARQEEEQADATC